nr:MAG TPA: hypothetical protein [Caudoviricetes sp.]
MCNAQRIIIYSSAHLYKNGCVYYSMCRVRKEVIIMEYIFLFCFIFLSLRLFS